MTAERRTTTPMVLEQEWVLSPDWETIVTGTDIYESTFDDQQLLETLKLKDLGLMITGLGRSSRCQIEEIVLPAVHRNFSTRYYAVLPAHDVYQPMIYPSSHSGRNILSINLCHNGKRDHFELPLGLNNKPSKIIVNNHNGNNLNATLVKDLSKCNWVAPRISLTNLSSAEMPRRGIFLLAGGLSITNPDIGKTAQVIVTPEDIVATTDILSAPIQKRPIAYSSPK